MTDSDPEEPTVVVRQGFVPYVSGSSVTVERAAATAVVAGGDVAMEQAGARLVIANGQVSIAQGGARMLLAGGETQIHQGGAFVAAAPEVEVHGGFVGLALGRRVELSDSRVLLHPLGALALGIGLGVGAAVASIRHGRKG